MAIATPITAQSDSTLDNTMMFLLNALLISGVSHPNLEVFIQFFKQYVFSDFTFIPTIGLLILLDTYWGIRHSTEGFTTKKLVLGLYNKAAKYGTLLMIAHSFRFYKVLGQPTDLYAGITYGIYSIIMVTEGRSIVKHMDEKTYNKILQVIILPVTLFKAKKKKDEPVD